MAVANLYKSGGELHFFNNIFLWFVENTFLNGIVLRLFQTKRGRAFDTADGAVAYDTR